MKTHINKAKHSLRAEGETWKMESLGLFFLLIVSRIKMVHAGTGYVFHSKRIGTERTPENRGFSRYPSLPYSSWWERKIVFKR